MIRFATLEDVPALVEMGKRFLRESPYHAFLAENPARMYELIAGLIEGSGGVLVSSMGDKITGMLGYILHNHFISGEPMAGEVFWWVEPEYRGQGIRLLHAVEAAAHKAGATKIQMIAPNERVGALYARLGYSPVETTFQRTL